MLIGNRRLGTYRKLPTVLFFSPLRLRSALYDCYYASFVGISPAKIVYHLLTMFFFSAMPGTSTIEGSDGPSLGVAPQRDRRALRVRRG
jgi:hypothetical protein